MIYSLVRFSDGLVAEVLMPEHNQEIFGSTCQACHKPSVH